MSLRATKSNGANYDASAAPANRLRGLQVFEALRQRMIIARARHVILQEYNALSAREDAILRDIGITREDLYAAVAALKAGEINASLLVHPAFRQLRRR